MTLPADVLFSDCQKLNIRDLVNVAASDPGMRRVVKNVIRTRVYGHLSTIIHHAHIPTFFSTLTRTQSVIGGSIALAAINPDFLKNSPPTNVNVFTPVGRLTDWDIYLTNIGFVSSTEAARQLPSCRTVVSFTFHNEEKRTNRTVIVYEAKGSSALTPIFESGYTCQMNFLTRDHLYCMHPHLTPQLKTLQVIRRQLTRKEREEETRLLNRGVVIMGTPEEITLCDDYVLCRSIFRTVGYKAPRLVDWPGDKIGILCWGINENESYLHSKRVEFWLGGECDNEACMQAVYDEN
ncbi:hypothetical protein GALMADRAFT_229038 [Galerina marginata CBS 339.88]|uniref:Uncharacterized protein n=1 Tax=Galerina marginata (strain CBS 339.88) TaxID=685588 RepID=A0A067SMM0_GALM3|nr:hypothetical protein GALMADRAFT_229038 [Galerina marginata CBS 339.88]